MEDIKLPIVLKKPRGRQYIHIDVAPDMGDDWFLRISYRKNKNDEEQNHHTIIRKDLDNWLRSLKNQKYVIQDEET
jgi:hypothetical protein